MPNITIHNPDNFEYSLISFKRACDRAGIVAEVRRREAYEKPTTVRKKAKAFAKKRLRLRLRRERINATRRF
jgi:small subunit ribosomal protein S21